MTLNQSSFFIILLIFLNAISAQAQYTETINSNRPGSSQGAFAVGTGVIQLEAGGYYGNDRHDLLVTDSKILGADYQLRYGFLFEALEISLSGSFEKQTIDYYDGIRKLEGKISNFKSNTLGLKFLIYDPARSLEPDKPNLYSWKANQRFKWKTLIPAVSVYAGANFAMATNPYLYDGEKTLSPKLALITQNNWRGSYVLVINLIADKLTEDNPAFIGIVTLTHAFNPKFAGFLEYQAIKNDIYADDIARTGLAYLLTDNFQVDISGLINFKNTPSRWQVAAGISYRLDLHKNDEFLEDSEKM